MKTDYPDLEGKTFDMEFQGDWNRVKVVGCNYHVGISVIDCADNEECYCLNRKELIEEGIVSLSEYKGEFFGMIKAIKTGKLSDDEFDEFCAPQHKSSASSMFSIFQACAFK
ncbi:MAG: hypothetical protein GY861_02705 [bacterium]|nr:hypothetical protein [bacterium]